MLWSVMFVLAPGAVGSSGPCDRWDAGWDAGWKSVQSYVTPYTPPPSAPTCPTPEAGPLTSEGSELYGWGFIVGSEKAWACAGWLAGWQDGWKEIRGPDSVPSKLPKCEISKSYDRTRRFYSRVPSPTEIRATTGEAEHQAGYAKGFKAGSEKAKKS